MANMILCCLSVLFILFAASAFRKLSSIYVFSYFPFGFEGRLWDLIVSVPDHCLSFYFLSGILKSLLRDRGGGGRGREYSTNMRPE